MRSRCFTQDIKTLSKTLIDEKITKVKLPNIFTMASIIKKKIKKNTRIILLLLLLVLYYSCCRYLLFNGSQLAKMKNLISHMSLPYN